MSKGFSGHFYKTKGATVYYGSSKQLYAQVRSWARMTATRLEGISKRQRDKFNTATVVYDVSNGKYYNGRNHGIEINHEKKNAILFGDKTHQGLLPKESLNNYVVGNCAEIHAVNKALNNGAKLSNLKMYTIHTTDNSFGKAKKSCENCTYALKGKIKTNYTGWEDGEYNDK